MAGLSDNILRVRERIAAAAAAAGKKADDVTLVAVSKNRSNSEIAAAVAAGLTVFGENRVQEAQEKIPVLAALACRWHLIGHLQRNKAARAIELFNVIQSLDSPRLADELERRAAGAGKVLYVMVEVNTSGEESKFGCGPDCAGELIAHAAALRQLRLVGLMTVGPLYGDRAAVVKSFATLRRLFEEYAPAAGPRFEYLSMGMSDDFEIAIAEGSNLVRIGRAIFDGV